MSVLSGNVLTKRQNGSNTLDPIQKISNQKKVSKNEYNSQYSSIDVRNRGYQSFRDSNVYNNQLTMSINTGFNEIPSPKLGPK